MNVGVDYGEAPVAVARTDTKIVSHFSNPHPMSLTAACTLHLPEEWGASLTRTVEVAASSEQAVEWKIEVPNPRKIRPSNRAWLTIETSNRPVQAAVPIVLAGARRVRLCGPYALEGRSEREAFDHVYDPERVTGDVLTPSGRPGNWKTVTLTDNALPLARFLPGAGVAYLQMFVWSPDDRPVAIMLHHNGPEREWINGQLLGEQWYHGPMRPAQHGRDNDRGHFRKGWNEILIKYTSDENTAINEAHVFLCHPGIGPDGKPNGSFNVGMVDVSSTALPWDE